VSAAYPIHSHDKLAYWLTLRRPIAGTAQQASHSLAGAESALNAAGAALGDVAADAARRDAELTREAGRATRRLALGLGAGCALALALALLLTLRLRRDLLAPIRHLTETVDRIHEGELDARAQIATGDELERLGTSLNTMLDRTVAAHRSATDKRALADELVSLLEQVSAASSGDLTVRGEVRQDELGSVTDALNHMLESIGQLVLEVRRAGAEVSASGSHILGASEEMAAGAAAQARALEEATRRIRQLGQRSLEINQIVELVEDIAAQTNLLALNAAIEASHAGERGKGFAVVADEVRKLAERSAAATKDIGAFIESIKDATGDTARAMEEIHSVTRTTEHGVVRVHGAATSLHASAARLCEAIARFRVPENDPQAASKQLAARLHEVTEQVGALAELAHGALASPSHHSELLKLLDQLSATVRAAQSRVASPPAEPAETAPEAPGRKAAVKP
jgi:methyl-accepting chemotaxis protein